MTRWLSRTWFRIRMMRYPKAPRNPRSADGRYISRREWRLAQMGRDDLLRRLGQ